MVLVRSGLGSEPGGDQRWRRRGRCRRWPVRILRAGSRGVPKARTPREFKQNRSSRIRSTRWSVQAVYYPLYYLVSPFLSLSLKHAPSNLLLSTLSGFLSRKILLRNCANTRDRSRWNEIAKGGGGGGKVEARGSRPSIERHACNTTREIPICLSIYLYLARRRRRRKKKSRAS